MINKLRVLYGDKLENFLINIDKETRIKLGNNWSQKKVNVKNIGTYRFINYLTTTGLLADDRKIAGKGWRKLSYVDCIYLELVLALRRLNVKADKIKYLFEIFSEEYNETKCDYMELSWLDILLSVHFGIEMELLINNENEEPIICDPSMMMLFGNIATKGQIRVSLSALINSARERSNLKPIEIKYHFGNLDINCNEIETISDIRSLSKKESIVIKKQEKGILIEKNKNLISDDDLIKKFSDLVEEEFGSITIQKEGGKIVNIHKTIKKILSN